MFTAVYRIDFQGPDGEVYQTWHHTNMPKEMLDSLDPGQYRRNIEELYRKSGLEVIGMVRVDVASEEITRTPAWARGMPTQAAYSH